MAEAARKNRSPDTWEERGALRAIAQLLCPTVIGQDLHIVDRGDLHSLLVIIIRKLDAACAAEDFD